MTVELPKKVEEDLRILASRQGRSIDDLLEEAVEQYLEAAAITDTTPNEVATTQEALLGELTNVPEWIDEAGARSRLMPEDQRARRHPPA